MEGAIFQLRYHPALDDPLQVARQQRYFISRFVERVRQGTNWGDVEHYSVLGADVNRIALIAKISPILYGEKRFLREREYYSIGGISNLADILLHAACWIEIDLFLATTRPRE